MLSQVEPTSGTALETDFSLSVVVSADYTYTVQYFAVVAGASIQVSDKLPEDTIHTTKLSSGEPQRQATQSPLQHVLQ